MDGARKTDSVTTVKTAKYRILEEHTLEGPNSAGVTEGPGEVTSAETKDEEELTKQTGKRTAPGREERAHSSCSGHSRSSGPR